MNKTSGGFGHKTGYDQTPEPAPSQCWQHCDFPVNNPPPRVNKPPARSPTSPARRGAPSPYIVCSVRSSHERSLLRKKTLPRHGRERPPGAPRFLQRPPDPRAAPISVLCRSVLRSHQGLSAKPSHHIMVGSDRHASRAPTAPRFLQRPPSKARSSTPE